MNNNLNVRLEVNCENPVKSHFRPSQVSKFMRLSLLTKFTLRRSPYNCLKLCAVWGVDMQTLAMIAMYLFFIAILLVFVHPSVNILIQVTLARCGNMSAVDFTQYDLLKITTHLIHPSLGPALDTDAMQFGVLGPNYKVL